MFFKGLQALEKNFLAFCVFIVIMRCMKSFWLLVIITSQILLFSCSAKEHSSDSELFSALGDDAYYYKGLYSLDAGDSEKASAFFTRCIQTGSKYCAQKSLAEYNKLQLKDIEESAPPVMETAKLIDWYTRKPLTKEHASYYEANLAKSFDVPPVVNFRMAVYKKDYAGAYNTYKISFRTFFMTPELYRDIGKMFLYVSNMYAGNAKYFESFVKSAQDESNYYIYFYCGRMKAKGGDFDGAKKSFSDAIKCAARLKDKAATSKKTPPKGGIPTTSSAKAAIGKKALTLTEAQKLFDNALWYLIDTGFKNSTDEGILLLKNYSEEFCEAHYYDDLFNALLLDLLSRKDFNEIYDIATATKGKASPDITARYSYIYARLVSEGLVTDVPGTLAAQKSLCAKLFTQALNADTDIYYKVMGLYNLNKIKKIKKLKARAIEVFFATPLIEKATPDEEASRFLRGFIVSGLYKRVYDECVEMMNNGVLIDTDTLFDIAQALSEEGVVDKDLYPQSLRLAQSAKKRPTRPLTKQDFRLLYPKDYKGSIENFSAHYGIPKSIMYALIRSESFFDFDVVSAANAKGLCQLMDMTAQDVARKLKVRTFDIIDPETNIEFGTYYLAELNHRLEGRWLPTFFSYNAGISRVRKWQKDTSKLFGREAVSNDLLLEMLPYEETREYGKKLVVATAMYEILWEGRTVDEVVKELL